MRVGGNKRLRMALGALETLSPLAVRLRLQRAPGSSGYPGAAFRAYMAAGGKARWQAKPLEQILPEVEGSEATISYRRGGGIITPLDELAALALITAAVRPKVVFEIGTFWGRTALNFALNTPDDGTVYTLDLPPGETIDTNTADRKLIDRHIAARYDYADSPAGSKVRQLYGDSRTFDFSPYHGRVDLFFVDGAHDYRSTLADSRNALACVKPGGLVVWHDFGNYGDYNDVMLAALEVAPDAVQVGATHLAVLRVSQH